MTAEDNAYFIVSYAYGWSEDDAESEKGITGFVKAMNYAANDDAAKARLEGFKQFKLDKGQCEGK